MKLKKSIFSDKAGAVFVASNSFDLGIHIWPAALGIKKYEGCVQYAPDFSMGTAVDLVDDNQACYLRAAECEKIYYDFPESEEAWLLTPRGKDWLWEQVDTQLELLKDPG